MTRFFLKIVFLLLFVTVLSSCVNLQHVNNFSSASLESIKKFEVINYSFNQSCLDNCMTKKMNDLNLEARECDCLSDKTADSVTLLIYHAIKGYLGGLACLSRNDLTNYKTDALTKALTTIDLGSIKIEKKQVDAYSNISKILLRAFTDKYRRHKIGEYVKEGNEPLSVLIRYLDFNLSANLTGKLNVQKQRLRETYFDLTKDQTLSMFDKRNVVTAYYERLDQIEAKQNELATYSKALKKIVLGHQKLTDNLSSINKDNIKEQLTRDASDIQDIIPEFNKISN